MSNCVKTGCYTFLSEYGIFIRGDAFKVTEEDIDGSHGFFYFRFNNASQSTRPTEFMLHFVVTEIEDWFDRNEKGVSTLIASGAIYYGYEGRPVDNLILVKGSP